MGKSYECYHYNPNVLVAVWMSVYSVLTKDHQKDSRRAPYIIGRSGCVGSPILRE